MSSGRKTEALVGFFGRRLALRRLARAIPKAFTPHGLATQLVVRRFPRALPAQMLLQPHRLVSPGHRLLDRLRGSTAPSSPPAAPDDGADEGPVEGIGYRRHILGVAPVAAVAAAPKVVAGAKLLTAAATNPKALAQVKKITNLAKVGNPAAKAALRTLRKANIFRRRRRAVAAAAAVPAAAAAALRSGSARTMTPDQAAASAAKRVPRFFKNWHRGAE